VEAEMRNYAHTRTDKLPGQRYEVIVVDGGGTDGGDWGDIMRGKEISEALAPMK